MYKPNGTLGHVTAVLITTVVLLSSCGKKSMDEHEHELDVAFSFTPTPAVVDTAIAFLFEVEEEGEHVSVENPECEIEKAGTGAHEEIALTEDSVEPGHYHGTHTFTEAGDYEVHFKFMHDGEMEEREFSMTVQSP